MSDGFKLRAGEAPVSGTSFPVWREAPPPERADAEVITSRTGLNTVASPARACAEQVPARRRPLRIAMISYSLPREGFKRGGIERVAHDLAHGLGRRGHHVTVYSHDPAPAGAAYRAAPLPWKAFVSTWAGRRLTMGYLGNVLAVMPGYEHADAIIAHGDSLFLPLRGRPVLRVMHGSALDEARSATSIGRRILQTGVYGLEMLTAVLQSHCVGVSANTRRSNPFVRHVIPNGVDLSVFYPDTAARASRPTIVFVGALDGRKRGAWLLDEFLTRIRPRYPDAELHMVCDVGPSQPGVVYRAGLSDDELAVLYRQAWVYASPSTYEGFGLPYLEAMASGTPVVATPNAGSREVLGDGMFGQLPSDDEFSPAVCGLLADTTRREQLVRAGLRRASELSLDRTLDAYESLLRTMVTSGA